MDIWEKSAELLNKYGADSLYVCDQVLEILIKQHTYNEKLTNYWLDVRNICKKIIDNENNRDSKPNVGELLP